jgi:hypothetical protein
MCRCVNKTSGQADPGLLFWAVDRNWGLPLEHYRVREGNTKDIRIGCVTVCSASIHSF